jgi:hypothetical protein
MISTTLHIPKAPYLSKDHEVDPTAHKYHMLRGHCFQARWIYCFSHVLCSILSFGLSTPDFMGSSWQAALGNYLLCSTCGTHSPDTAHSETNNLQMHMWHARLASIDELCACNVEDKICDREFGGEGEGTRFARGRISQVSSWWKLLLVVVIGKKWTNMLLYFYIYFYSCFYDQKRDN